MSQGAFHGQETRPRTSEISIKHILSFPLRICNPPPAVAKVRSCGVTPLFQVRLEDVLDRKHLPPLGLKDFEEWLLFVEMSPENLYFTLWLREYRQRYNEWVAQTQFHRELNSGQEFRSHWHPQHSPSLALFYARAKQTFFAPNSPYELNLPSSLLSVFHTSTESPHPDPAIFTDVAIETYRVLDESLRRFVTAQFNNVGNSRVLCGMVAGTFCAVAGSLPPIILNFVRPSSRWTRMLAFPGLFFGLTVLITALNGICMGVYFFGDFRQLRKFELSRPQISKPQQLETDDGKADQSFSSPSPDLPLPALSHVANSPSFADARVAHLMKAPSVSSRLSGESIPESTNGQAPGGIHISPAFWDDSSFIDVETGVISAKFQFPPPSPEEQSNEGDFTSTAGFIRQFDSSNLRDNFDGGDISPQHRQPIGEFDFDALPPRARRPRTNQRHSQQYERDYSIAVPEPTHSVYTVYPSYPYPIESHPPNGFLEHVQSRCDIKRWRLETESQDQITSPTTTVFSSSNPYNAHIIHKSRRSFSTDSTMESTDTKVRKRFRLINAVPAFAVPLTRVLSPVVRRGQWEIVVRSGLIALVLSWIIVGSLLAIPEPRR